MAAPKGTRPPNAGKGRKAGVPNKATARSREVLAKIFEDNVETLEVWLKAVADGEKEPTADGVNGKWLRRPDPGLAARLMLDLAEFHVPKLARNELTGA